MTAKITASVYKRIKVFSHLVMSSKKKLEIWPTLFCVIYDDCSERDSLKSINVTVKCISLCDKLIFLLGIFYSINNCIQKLHNTSSLLLSCYASIWSCVF